MSQAEKLLVPIYAEALVLRDDRNMVDMRPQLKNFANNVLGSDIDPSYDNLSLKKGVHLHWTLPKALKHAFVNDRDKDMEFPVVPNRWLVVRSVISPKKAGISCSAWMIDSSFVNKPGPGTSPNLLTFENDEKRFVVKSTGRKMPLAEFKESSEPNTITAMPPGDPFFAAFYPACENVFGMHDNLEDINGDCTLSYLVTGWYNNPNDDPLTPLDFTGELTAEDKKRKRLQDYIKQQWTFTGGGDVTVDSCLLHTSVHSIKWSGTTVRVPGGEVNVYVGNTSMEAQSVNIRHTINGAPEAEDLLNALQYQLLDDEQNIPSLPEMREEAHRRAFSSKTGGKLWEIRLSDKANDNAPAQPDKRLQFPQNRELLQIFNQLNDGQQTLNRLERELESQRQEYYFLWYKNTYAENKGNSLPFDYEKLAAGAVPAIAATEALLKENEKSIESLLQTLRGFSEFSGQNAEFKLENKPENRFWEPNDPVLLLTGPGVGDTEKPNMMGSDKILACRLFSELKSVLTLYILLNNKREEVKINHEDVETAIDKCADLKRLLPAVVYKLLCEAVLLDNGFAGDIAFMVFDKAGIAGQKQRTDELIVKYANNVVVKEQQNCSGKISIAINQSEQPWSPLFMQWEVKFTPAFDSLRNADLKNNQQWMFENMLEYKANATDFKGAERTISFVSPLSAAIYGHIKRLLPADLVEKYGKMNLISQSLSGLHKKLLMQHAGIQLPPLDYEVARDDDGDIMYAETTHQVNSDVLELTGSNGYRLAPDIDNLGGNLFHPLRAGTLQITKLNIIDAFGRKKVVIDSSAPAPLCAQSFCKAGAPYPGGKIPLAPRLLQGARVKFDWLDKDDKIVYQDTHGLNSPVFGWVVPNYLDNSLMIFGHAGQEVAILQITSDVTKKAGFNLNRMPFPGARDIPPLTDNPQLGQFLGQINSGTMGAGLIDLALKIHLGLAGSKSLTDSAGPLISGAPIALVRCAIGLELYGRPALDQSGAKTGLNDTGFIETVKIPLYLGDREKSNDGLLGYFTNEEPFFNTTIHAPKFVLSEEESRFRKNQPLMLSVGAAPVNLTLMLDAAAGMHISCGVLPVKFVELFPHDIKAMIQMLNVGFMVAPFIAEEVEPGIPVPAGINANWKWTHQTDVDTWQKDTDIPDAKNKKTSNFSRQQLYEGWLKLNPQQNKTHEPGS
jgi:hypothetical protein